MPENRALVPSLLGGAAVTRSMEAAAWRQPWSAADKKLLTAALPSGTPLTVGLANVHAIPVAKTNLASSILDADQFVLRIVAVPYAETEGAPPTHVLVYAVGGGNLKGYKKEFTGLIEDLTRWIVSTARR